MTSVGQKPRRVSTRARAAAIKRVKARAAARARPDRRWHVETTVAAVAAVAAIVAAFIAGSSAADTAKAEFLRDQQIVAYGQFSNDLLAFEDTYEEAKKLLDPNDKSASLSKPEPDKLITQVTDGLNKIRRSKATVDIVGSEATAAAARSAIDDYGPIKGTMVDDLEARKIGKPPIHGGHADKLGILKDRSREFSEQATASLEIPGR